MDSINKKVCDSDQIDIVRILYRVLLRDYATYKLIDGRVLIYGSPWKRNGEISSYENTLLPYMVTNE